MSLSQTHRGPAGRSAPSKEKGRARCDAWQVGLTDSQATGVLRVGKVLVERRRSGAASMRQQREMVV
jgi:hypothetical protein